MKGNVDTIDSFTETKMSIDKIRKPGEVARMSKFSKFI